MQWSAFQLARRVTQVSRSVWPLVVVGVVAGILMPVLVVDLGLIVQLLADRSGASLPHDWLLAPLLSLSAFPWPYLGSSEWCLVFLIGLGWLAAIAETVATVLLRRGAHARALSVTNDLRRKIYTQTFRLGPYDLLGATRTRPDELFSDKVELIRRGFVYCWTTVPQAVVALASLLGIAALVNGWLTLLAILLAGCLVRLHRHLRIQEEQHKERWRELGQRQEGLLRDLLNMAPLLKGYLLVEPPVDQFDANLRANAQAELQLARSEYLLRPLLWLGILVAAGFVMLIIGLGPGSSLAGTVVLVAALLIGYVPFMRLIRIAAVVREMDSAADDIKGFLDREPGVLQLPDARPLDRLARSIVLDRVSLADRHGRQLLHNVALEIPAGRTVAVIASDAQTPAAIAGMFVRFYDPAAGWVLFDGQDIRHATLDTIRGQTGLVFRDGLLFPGNILQNVTCDDSGFTSMQVNDALKRAAALEFVRALPEQLLTIVGNPGQRLRLDQTFRIGLARALLRDPSLLVVEEPAVADEAAERELDEALGQAAAQRTLIILPSRIATLRNAEIIFMFHAGKLAGQGKHADLLQSSELYRHLCYVRFNPFRDTAQ